MSEEEILYEVRDRAVIITLNAPKRLNALDFNGYLQLAKYVEAADQEEGTILTLIQSTGRYFSAGANIGGGALTQNTEELFSHEYWVKNFVGRNTYVTDVFHNHSKILAAAVNGPVIGLSTGLLALCDLVYVKDESEFYMLAPFANLGLVAEGASSATLFLRLGWSKSAEALLLAKPIKGPELKQLGFINKSYNGKFKSTEDFNAHVLKELTESFKDLHEPSILENKALLRYNRDQFITSANSREAVRGFYKWIEGAPQTRFAQLLQKEIKHKI